jgi:uncharacterized SAM-binding protein YcdF (DUF218 family)
MFDKFLIALISPLGGGIVLLLCALLLGWQKRGRLASFLGWAGLLWLTVWSLPVASHVLRGWVESGYPPRSAAMTPSAQAIVVLGGGVRPPEVSGQAPDLKDAADRVWHGVRLFHAGKAPLLLMSGGSDLSLSASSEAEVMRQFAMDLGVPIGAIVMEGRSRNTRQNAQFSAEILKAQGVKSVLLVTSALHMRRAVALFESQGLMVTPAATDHEARSRFSGVDWLPDAGALDGSARAMKEMVARWSGR